MSEPNSVVVNQAPRFGSNVIIPPASMLPTPVPVDLSRAVPKIAKGADAVISTLGKGEKTVSAPRKEKLDEKSAARDASKKKAKEQLKTKTLKRKASEMQDRVPEGSDSEAREYLGKDLNGPPVELSAPVAQGPVCPDTKCTCDVCMRYTGPTFAVRVRHFDRVYLQQMDVTEAALDDLEENGHKFVHVGCGCTADARKVSNNNKSKTAKEAPVSKTLKTKEECSKLHGEWKEHALTMRLKFLQRGGMPGCVDLKRRAIEAVTLAECNLEATSERRSNVRVLGEPEFLGDYVHWTTARPGQVLEPVDQRRACTVCAKVIDPRLARFYIDGGERHKSFISRIAASAPKDSDDEPFEAPADPLLAIADKVRSPAARAAAKAFVVEYAALLQNMSLAAQTSQLMLFLATYGHMSGDADQFLTDHRPLPEPLPCCMEVAQAFCGDMLSRVKYLQKHDPKKLELPTAEGCETDGEEGTTQHIAIMQRDPAFKGAAPFIVHRVNKNADEEGAPTGLPLNQLAEQFPEEFEVVPPADESGGDSDPGFTAKRKRAKKENKSIIREDENEFADMDVLPGTEKEKKSESVSSSSSSSSKSSTSSGKAKAAPAAANTISVTPILVAPGDYIAQVIPVVMAAPRKSDADRAADKKAKRKKRTEEQRTAKKLAETEAARATCQKLGAKEGFGWMSLDRFGRIFCKVCLQIPLTPETHASSEYHKASAAACTSGVSASSGPSVGAALATAMSALGAATAASGMPVATPIVSSSSVSVSAPAVTTTFNVSVNGPVSFNLPATSRTLPLPLPLPIPVVSKAKAKDNSGKAMAKPQPPVPVVGSVAPLPPMPTPVSVSKPVDVFDLTLDLTQSDDSEATE